MPNGNQTAEDKVFITRALEAAIQIGLVALLIGWCYLIIKAFINPVLWGLIMAVGIYPFYKKVTAALGGREKLTAVLITLMALALLIIPTVLLTESTVSGIQALSKDLEAGTLTIPPPSEKVATWPVIGEPLDDLWRLASVNIDAAIAKIAPQLKAYAPKVLSVVAGLGSGFLQFFISIIIAGAFLSKAESGKQATNTIFTRLTRGRGEAFTTLVVATIRSVVQGVLGIAIIQSILAGIGFIAVGVPGAGLWALLVLFLAVIQLPPLLIIGPIIFYVFSTTETTPAVIFMIWGILVSLSDAFLKPLLLGRGVEVPVLVILLGAIGGMMFSGIIGLFLGAVILSIGYKVLQAWLNT